MKSKYLGLVILCSLALSSCKDKPKTAAESFLRPASMSYSKQDTTNIEAMVNQYAQFVKARDFKSAAAMLFKVRHDSIFPLSDNERSGFIKAYSNMPIYNSRVKSFVLRSDKNNQIDVLVQILKDGDLDKGIGVTTISLNPVVKKGKWYLTLLDKKAEGVIDVYDPNVSNY